MKAPSVTRFVSLLTIAIALGANVSIASTATKHKKPSNANTYNAKSSARTKSSPGANATAHIPTKNSTARNSATSKSVAVAKSSVKSSAVAGKPNATKSGGKKSARHSSKSSGRQRGQTVPTPARITEIQEALAKNGTLNATPSGKWDDSTTEAMRRFQAAHGLNPSGKLDARSLNELGLGSATAGVAPPAPSSVHTSASAVPPPHPPVRVTSSGKPQSSVQFSISVISQKVCAAS
jgi:hypothetical protein